ncbi:MAG TPA: hypothetical protein PKC41_12520, partial [Chitinophagaceae bacterium]|nr:hypothetical protein [Chitinophagaceae bacterium]
MKKHLLFLSLMMISITLFAQKVQTCADTKILSMQRQAKKTRANPYANSLMSQYDVHFYFLDIYAERNNTLVGGVVTIGAKVTASSLDTFCFELNQSMVIDSVVYNNQSLTLGSNGSIRYAVMPNALPLNTNMSVKIYY